MKLDLVFRLSAFLGVLGLMASWEVLAPRRPLSSTKFARWAANLSIVALDSVIIRLLFGAAAVGAAVVAADRDWGLLHRVSWPLWSEFILAIVLLDFVLYAQHVMFHTVPWFWRFHMMHHADLDCDVTTGLRFHPVEVALSMVIKLGAVALIGASPSAVLVFEIVLNATSMFNHSNVWMPAAVDRVLRWFLVTPDMHRIHHSTDPTETNSNFGFNLPWWDRLLGTYRDEPIRGHAGIIIGLEQFRDPRRLTFVGILLLPFLGTPGRYPLLQGKWSVKARGQR